jgi:hypothetical protein
VCTIIRYSSPTFVSHFPLFYVCAVDMIELIKRKKVGTCLASNIFVF